MPKTVISKEKFIPYVGLRDWNERNDLSYEEIGELLEVSSLVAGRCFRGITDMRKDMIDKILDLTGLTYEEAFRKEV